MISSNTTDSNIFADKKWFIINIMLGDDELIKKVLLQAKVVQSSNSKAIGDRPSVTHITYDELQKRGSLRHKSKSNFKAGDLEMTDHKVISDSPVFVADYFKKEEETLYEKLVIKVNRLFGEFQHATFYEYECEYFFDLTC
jgi:hypothetical protein